jgi:hypothetical protein
MEEYNKNQILEITGISNSLYKQHLKEIKSSPLFSGHTYLKRIDYPNLNRKYQIVRYFKQSLLNYFFFLKIKPRDKNNNKKYRSYIKSLKTHYTITITPQMNKQDNIKLMEFFRKELQKTYGDNLKTFEYNVEYDPNNTPKNYFHSHLLLEFKSETDFKGVKEHFTRYLDEKVGKSKIIEFNEYYDPENKAGNRYFVKEGVVRFID